MAHFAILCPEDISHVLVSGAIGKELVGRGHRVTVVAPAGAAAAADEFGLPLIPSTTTRFRTVRTFPCGRPFVSGVRSG